MLKKSINYSGLSFTIISCAMLGLILSALTVTAQDEISAVGQLKNEAENLQKLVVSDPAHLFLKAVVDLPSIKSPRLLYFNKKTREALSSAEFEKLTDSARTGFEKHELDENYYYNTRYGSPLAFVRPLDLISQAGFKSFEKVRIIDFGFGSIGQLRLMASLGATAVGIDVDQTLKVLYNQPGDKGEIARSSIAKKGNPGQLEMLIGSFPSDKAIRNALTGKYDVFISKNTLKRGYIHPEREVDPRMLIDLGVDDSTYVKTVFDLLKPGGFFMIYNLHPAQSKADQPYIPWADGRSPFSKELLEQTGFSVIEFDKDDTEFAHKMAKELGWDAQMNLETDLFGKYTLLRK